MTDVKTVPVTDLPSLAPDNPLEALSWLGDTVEEIAEGLRARGIKGQRMMGNHCPIGNYLKTWWSGGEEGYIFVCPMYFKIGGSSWETPYPVSEFVKRFDNLHYPRLIA